jgi:hypothetical protein
MGEQKVNRHVCDLRMKLEQNMCQVGTGDGLGSKMQKANMNAKDEDGTVSIPVYASYHSSAVVGAFCPASDRMPRDDNL